MEDAKTLQKKRKKDNAVGMSDLASGTNFRKSMLLTTYSLIHADFVEAVPGTDSYYMLTIGILNLYYFFLYKRNLFLCNAFNGVTLHRLSYAPNRSRAENFDPWSATLQ